MYLGIDQSLRALGIAMLDLTGKYVASRTISVVGTGGARLSRIRSEIVSFVDCYATRPDVCAIQAVAREGFAFKATNRSFDLGMVAGVVEEVVWSRIGLLVRVVPPASLKKFATGSGAADKTKMLYAVKTRFGVDLGDRDDEADAVMLAAFAKAALSGDRPTTRAAAEAVHALTRPKKPRLRRTTNARNI